MALPEIKVEIAFDSSNLTQVAFVLDDFPQGALDNQNFRLGGFAFVDVSQYLKSVEINRGKSRLLDTYESGAANIVFDNTQRVFDPFFTPSPFFGAITPRLEIKIYADDIEQYTGVILDWNLDYDLSGDSTATAVCVDKFTNLAQASIDVFFPDVQTSGERITTILDLPEVDFDSEEREIDTGLTTLIDNQIPAGTNALEYLQQIEKTELGSLFVSKTGNLRFKERNSSLNFNTVFADDGTGILFSDVGNVFGTELLYNRVVITPEGSSPIARKDDTSIAAFGLSTFSETTLHNFDSDAELLADYLLDKYKNPAYRFDRLVINLSNLTPTQVEDVLNLELDDGTEIIFTPSGIGDPIEQSAKIIGFNHSISQTEYILELQLESFVLQPLVLDSTTLGVLNEGTLGF